VALERVVWWRILWAYARFHRKIVFLMPTELKLVPLKVHLLQHYTVLLEVMFLFSWAVSMSFVFLPAAKERKG
jgi:hypothetical protein